MPGSGSKRLTEQEALGLVGSVSLSNGEKAGVGAEVLVRGRILRVHPSGFTMVAVHGPKPQPGILVHGENMERGDGG